MNLNKIKRIILKKSPLIIILLTTILAILVCLIVPIEIASYIFFTTFILSCLLRLIMEVIYKSRQIKLSIKNKLKTIEKLYEIFNLEDTKTLVSINTSNEQIVSNAKKLFVGTKEQKRKKVYSLMLTTSSLEKIRLFLKDNNPERIIIHQFCILDKENKHKVTHSLSICVDDKLIIHFNKKEYSYTKIKEIKNILKKENNL